MTTPAVVAYDPGWPAAFTAAAAALTPLLTPWARTAVVHVGSTAIPGMIAKPLLDMMIGVADLPAAAAAAAALAEAGWERRVHRVDAELVVHVDAGVVTRSLQLTVPDGDLWRERLAFRDALRADPTLVARYCDLKRALLAAGGGQPYLAADKRGFVREVLAGRGVTLRDDRHVPRADD